MKFQRPWLSSHDAVARTPEKAAVFHANSSGSIYNLRRPEGLAWFLRVMLGLGEKPALYQYNLDDQGQLSGTLLYNH